MAKNNDVIEEINEDSPWFFFYSVGCAFCTKMEPIIEELNDNGAEILRLDLKEVENQKLYNELKQEYKVQCGTPWLINADTGKGICGYRDKGTVEKWLAGEDIPEPPRPRSQMPRPPFMGATGKQETAWKKEYKKWVEENSHLPSIMSADEILAKPRPKNDPPKFPPVHSTDDEIVEFGKKWDEWAEENKHLPNIQKGDVLVENLKRRKNQPIPNQANQPIEKRLITLEEKMDKMMKHFGVK